MSNQNKNEINQKIDSIVNRHGHSPHAVIPILQSIQDEYKYLPEEALRRVCEITDIRPADITGVSTFYSQFRHKPVGEHTIHVCTGTACHVKGAELVHDAFKRELAIPDDDDTDPNGQFTLQKVACLGCCTLAPVVQIDQVTYGHVSTDTVPKVLLDFLSKDHSKTKKDQARHVDESGEVEIRVGLGSCCVAGGSGDVMERVESSLQELGAQARVKRVGCVGMCHRTPLLEVVSPESGSKYYDKVQPEHVPDIMLQHFKPKSLLQRLKLGVQRSAEQLYTDTPTDEISRLPLHQRDPHVEAFLGQQQHIATEFCGEADPLDMTDYTNRGGFTALQSCLTGKSADEIIEIISNAGLRGRGGAGFPTGKKWQIARSFPDKERYLVCNGDEGDPGAFMDRMILESYPFRVLEGMIIAAYAVGATRGYLYIRAEYPLAVQRVQSAIDMCRQHHLLGENILGIDFSLDLEIMQGAGAFVCGEETALLQSIEGKRGMPRFRPPYPAEQGLWGHSTLVNNCETLALVPWIVRNGAEAFSKLGTDKSSGTKVFSLAGKIARGGLIEVPMGISIREIVEEIGGGIEGGKRFKAVQVGGPSGGCVPSELAHTRVDYEELTGVGAMMGSGGLLVMDENDCMVDIARFFLTFTYEQSCGKCTFCRIGTRHMLEILENLCSGKAVPGDLEKLRELAEETKRGSLCGLGKTAPNPVLSTLDYFYDEYKAHLNGECPAKKCAGLIRYEINDECIGCTLCAQQCPTDAIELKPYEQHEVIQENCIKCDTCRQVCPVDAVEVI